MDEILNMNHDDHQYQYQGDSLDHAPQYDIPMETARHNMTKYSHKNRNIKQNSPSIISMLLLFYIAIGNNYTDRLLSRDIQVAIRESRTAQHILGFMLLLVIVFMFGNMQSVEMGLLYTIVGYAWFIFSTKLEIRTNIIILAIMLLLFLYEHKVANSIENISEDILLSGEEKIKALSHYNGVKHITLGVIVVLTIAGCIVYAIDEYKPVQSGGGNISSTARVLNYLFY